MKLSVAIISFALLCGCASAPVMRPDVNAPTMNEQQNKGELPPAPNQKSSDERSDSPCWDKVRELAGQAAESAKQKYQEVKESGVVEDAKEAAKKAGQKLYDKATEYYDAVVE